MKVFMFANMMKLKPICALAALFAFQPAFAADTLADSAAVEFGTGSKVQMLRFSAQKNWERSWFESNGTHLSGYWDANLAQWRGNAYQNRSGEHQNITVVNLTPVFRFERADKKGWYAEGGIGVSLLSELYDNDDNRLSTHFQFGDHIGAGYVFDNKWELGAKIQHYSNGGYKKPNSGVNWLVVKVARHF
ncbi:MAG: Lipid deacylase [Massilia sp.]|jgi:lipid A 3-O-deacylase|nr:Lipid deacylase [Massilia sp.]MDB5952747.1 Lipid deacylase [Massilia sp.]